MKPDSAAEPAGVRVRRLTRVRASGKVLEPSPTSATHSSGKANGAHSRPANPHRWQAAQASASGNGLRRRAASAGMPNEATRPRVENRATMPPPNPGPAPASTNNLGSQVNIA